MFISQLNTKHGPGTTSVAGHHVNPLLISFVLVSLYRLVDDRCVVEPAAGDLENPPKKFRGMMECVCSLCR